MHSDRKRAHEEDDLDINGFSMGATVDIDRRHEIAEEEGAVLCC